jgi:hypothetical protein
MKQNVCYWTKQGAKNRVVVFVIKNNQDFCWYASILIYSRKKMEQDEQRVKLLMLHACMHVGFLGWVLGHCKIYFDVLCPCILYLANLHSTCPFYWATLLGHWRARFEWDSELEITLKDISLSPCMVNDKSAAGQIPRAYSIFPLAAIHAWWLPSPPNQSSIESPHPRIGYPMCQSIHSFIGTSSDWTPPTRSERMNTHPFDVHFNWKNAEGPNLQENVLICKKTVNSTGYFLTMDYFWINFVVFV